MGLGSTAKKIQAISERAEAMYRQVQELQRRIIDLEEEVDESTDTVDRIDHQLTEQRALLLAIAEEQGLDGEAILAEAAIEDVDLDDGAADDGGDGTDATDGDDRNEQETRDEATAE